MSTSDNIEPFELFLFSFSDVQVESKMILIIRIQLIYAVLHISFIRSVTAALFENEMRCGLHPRNGSKPEHSLRVSVHHFESLYKNKYSEFYNGIEYKLIRTIAEKEHRKISVQIQRHSTDFADQIFKYDVFVGGLFPNVSSLGAFTFSKPYYQEELVWCIQRAKNYPMVITVFLAVTPLMWFILVICIGGAVALITYIMIPFDLKNPRRNFIDFNYVALLIVLPMVIGCNLRHFPQKLPCRMFYAYTLLTAFFLWQLLFYFGARFIVVPVQRHQISTVRELNENNYHLIGTKEAFHLIQFDKRVC